MSRVHYFQRYSQKENVATNNSLLLLSRLQATDPRMLQKVLAGLVNDQEIEIGAQFHQQRRDGGGSVPDGEIRQQSLQILLETKTHPGFSTTQLEGHLKKFDPSVHKKVLLLLSPEVATTAVRAKGVSVQTTTFARLVEACRAAVAGNSDLEEIVADFEDYCLNENFISSPGDRLLIVPVRISLADNHKYRLYYCPADRTIQPHRYIGLYAAKTVSAIGIVQNVVLAQRSGRDLEILEKEKPLDADQKQRILGAMADASHHGYTIDENHRFFLVEEFVATDFRKTTPGGLFNRRYFSVREELDLAPNATLPDLAEIAERLKSCTWE